MKKLLIGSGILGGIAAAALVGALMVSPILAQGPSATPAGSEKDGQTPLYSATVQVDEALYENMSEADEAVALASQATLTADEAIASAVAANPGSGAVKTELDNENGALVYSVELDNGLDVKVDAASGAVLNTEQAGSDEQAETADQAGDTDSVQDESESQVDEGVETPAVEDAAAQ